MTDADVQADAVNNDTTMNDADTGPCAAPEISNVTRPRPESQGVEPIPDGATVVLLQNDDKRIFTKIERPAYSTSHALPGGFNPRSSRGARVCVRTPARTNRMSDRPTEAVGDADMERHRISPI